MIKDVAQKQIPSLGVPTENSIPGTIKSAGGTQTAVSGGVFRHSDNTTYSGYSITVSGLSFKPKMIIIKVNTNSNATTNDTYWEASGSQYVYYAGNTFILSDQQYVNSTGFCLVANSSQVRWMAFSEIV